MPDLWENEEMLRVEFDHDGNGTLMVRLQGRLAGPYAEDAMVALERYQDQQPILVDLSQLIFVDLIGEQVLSWLGRRGAGFVAANLYSRSVCERLRLRLSENGNGARAGNGATTKGNT
jgi:hypothetical protein